MNSMSGKKCLFILFILQSFFFMASSEKFYPSIPKTEETLFFKTWNEARKGGEWKYVTEKERFLASGLFKALLNDNISFSGIKELQIGTGLEVLRIKNSFYIIHEKKKRGQGFFIIRRGKCLPILSQSPHSGTDRYTGTIGMRFFVESGIKAAAFNSLSRQEVDLAHKRDTYFQVFTLAFSTHFSKYGKILQWHGFNPDKRQTLEARSADMIVSNGTVIPSKFLKNLVSCLYQGTLTRILIYPLDTKELGGTTNKQVKLLLLNGFNNFIHLEMSLGFRKKIKENQKLRQIFFKCFSNIKL